MRRVSKRKASLISSKDTNTISPTGGSPTGEDSFNKSPPEIKDMIWSMAYRQHQPAAVDKLFFSRDGMSIHSVPNDKLFVCGDGMSIHSIPKELLRISHVCQGSRAAIDREIHKDNFHIVNLRVLNMDTTIFYIADANQYIINPVKSGGISGKIERWASIFPPFADEKFTLAKQGKLKSKEKIKEMIGPYKRFAIISSSGNLLEDFLLKIKHVALNLSDPRGFLRSPFIGINEYNYRSDFNNGHVSDSEVKARFKVFLRRLCQCRFLADYTSNYEQLDLVILKDQSHTYNRLMSEVDSDGKPIRETVLVDWKEKLVEVNAIIKRDAERVEKLQSERTAKHGKKSPALRSFHNLDDRHREFAKEQWNYMYTPKVLRLFEAAKSEFLVEDESDGNPIKKPQVIRLVVDG